MSFPVLGRSSKSDNAACTACILLTICMRYRTDPDGQYKMRLLIEDGIKPRALGTPVNAPPAIKYKPAQVYTSAKLAAKGRTAAAYVESLEGKRFQIEFEDCRPYRHVDLAVRLYVDGQQ